MARLTLGSLFDGIGGFPYAAALHGITPIWASEVEPACVSVTRRHFPGMEHLGDITQINGAGIGPADIIAFGSPCQDLSVAGKRAGLGGARSGLFMEAIRIIEEMRAATDARHPAIAVWENVPGALSSRNGLDFRAVLQAFAGAEVPMPGSGRWASAGMVRGGRCDIAWRVMDAQYWGVPQRRRRIFLVADFGGRRAAEILFVERGVPGHPAQGGEAREEAAGGAGGGVEAAGFNGWRGVTGSIEYKAGRAPCIQSNMPPDAVISAFMGGQGAKAGGIGYREGAAPTLKTSASGTNLAPVACIQGSVAPVVCKTDQAGSNGLGISEGVAYTLDGAAGQAVVYGIDENKGATLDGMGTLQAHQGGGHQNYVATVYAPETARCLRANGKQSFREDKDTLICAATGQAGAEMSRGKSPALNCSLEQPYIAGAATVRRLTPRECERLQGFPDDWTASGHDGKPISDSRRYMMIGNSVAIPCVDHVMAGIAAALGEAQARGGDNKWT